MSELKLPATTSSNQDAAWNSSGYNQEHGTSRPAPDRFANSQLYQGLLSRRVIAFLIDAAILTLIGAVAWFGVMSLVVLTLGLLSPVAGILVVLPITYHCLFLTLRAATPGMAVMDLILRGPTGDPPDFARALALTVVFYLSLIPPAWLVLLVPLFNSRRRCLHDWLTHCTLVRHSVWAAG